MIDYNRKQRILPHGLINPASIKDLFKSYTGTKRVNLIIHFFITIASLTSNSHRNGAREITFETDEVIRLSGIKFRERDWSNKENHSARMNELLLGIIHAYAELEGTKKIKTLEFNGNEWKGLIDWNKIKPRGGGMYNYRHLNELLYNPTAYKAYLLICSMTHRNGGYMNRDISLRKFTEMGWNCNTKNPRATRIKVKKSLEFLHENKMLKLDPNDEWSHFMAGIHTFSSK